MQHRCWAALANRSQRLSVRAGKVNGELKHTVESELIKHRRNWGISALARERPRHRALVRLAREEQRRVAMRPSISTGGKPPATSLIAETAVVIEDLLSRRTLC